MEESKFKFPTETIEFPSKGLIYPEDNPLSSGTIEMKYMTAKEEDILSNQSYIQNGTVLDKLLKSLIISKIDYNELIVGDKNAIMFAARILSYGKDYTVMYADKEITVDLSKLELKYIDENVVTEGTNEFTFKLPNTDNIVTYKLLSHWDERTIEREIEGLKKINKNSSPEVTTRMKRMITSVNGLRESKDIREFVDNFLLASDARALRKEYARINPDVNMKFTHVDEDGGEEDVVLPIGIGFFWPDNAV